MSNNDGTPSFSRDRLSVIGGAGFIGESLIEKISIDGGTPLIIGRSEAQSEIHSTKYSYLKGDYSNPVFLRDIVSKSSRIINLAHATTPSPGSFDPLHDIESNVTAAVQLFQAVADSQIQRLVTVSSGGAVYGPSEAIPVVETHATAPVSSYGVTKLAIDHYARLFFLQQQLPVVIVRPGNAYGEHQQPFKGQGFIATAIGCILKGIPVQIFGDGSTVRDYIHVSDVASGILAALESGVSGEIYNIGTGIGTSNLEILDALEPLAAQEGYKVKREFKEARGVDVLYNVLDSSKLMNRTGWKPVISLEEGLARVWGNALRSIDLAK